MIGIIKKSSSKYGYIICSSIAKIQKNMKEFKLELFSIKFITTTFKISLR
jgi:hypothetical protein